MGTRIGMRGMTLRGMKGMLGDPKPHVFYNCDSSYLILLLRWSFAWFALGWNCT